MTDNVRLDGKVAIVTGSGRGLGQAIKEADLFRSGKPIKFGKYTIRDFGTSRRDSAPRAISSFFSNSSNIVASKVAPAVGILTYREYLYKFGLLSKIEAFPDSIPLIPQPFRTVNLTLVRGPIASLPPGPRCKAPGIV
jgi:hypothetical protein